MSTSTEHVSTSKLPAIPREQSVSNIVTHKMAAVFAMRCANLPSYMAYHMHSSRNVRAQRPCAFETRPWRDLGKQGWLRSSCGAISKSSIPAAGVLRQGMAARGDRAAAHLPHAESLSCLMLPLQPAP